MQLRDYLRIIKRQRLIILLSFAMILLIYMVSILRKPVEFLAVSKLYLRPPTLQEAMLLRSTMAPTANPYHVTMSNQLLLIQSRTMKRKVVSQVNMAKRFSRLSPGEQKKVLLSPFGLSGCSRENNLMMQIRKADFKNLTPADLLKVTVVPVAESNVIEVRVQHRHQDAAMVIANAVVEIGCWENHDVATQEFTRARQYLESQADYYASRQEMADEDLKAFNKEYGTLNFDQELLSRVNRLANLQFELEHLKIKKSESEAATSILKKRISSPETQPDFDSSFLATISDYRNQILPLQMELIALREKYADGHPKVKSVVDKINGLKNQARKDMLSGRLSRGTEIATHSDAFSSQLVDSEIARATVDIREKALMEILNREENVLRNFSDQEINYAKLMREKNTTQKLADTLLEMLEQMKVTEVMKAGNAQVMEEALDAKKIARGNAQMFLLAFLVSAAMGITCGVALDFLDDRIRTSHHVSQYLNMEVLGTIPYIPEENQRLLLTQGLKSPLSETFHKIAVQLEQSADGAKSFLITSAIPKEGKSTVVFNMGVALARIGETVILLDTDLRRPYLHHLLGHTNTVGLTSLLTGKLKAEETLDEILEGRTSPEIKNLEHFVDEVLWGTEVPGLSVMQSGPTVPNPVSLLRLPQMKDIVDILKSKVSFVFLDAPPVSAVADVVVLGKYVDGILLVVDSKNIRRKEAVQTKQVLEKRGFKTLAVILNNISTEEDEVSYYYYGRSYKES